MADGDELGPMCIRKRGSVKTWHDMGPIQEHLEASLRDIGRTSDPVMENKRGSIAEVSRLPSVARQVQPIGHAKTQEALGGQRSSLSSRSSSKEVSRLSSKEMGEIGNIPEGSSPISLIRKPNRARTSVQVQIQSSSSPRVSPKPTRRYFDEWSSDSDKEVANRQVSAPPLLASPPTAPEPPRHPAPEPPRQVAPEAPMQMAPEPLWQTEERKTSKEKGRRSDAESKRMSATPVAPEQPADALARPKRRSFTHAANFEKDKAQEDTASPVSNIIAQLRSSDLIAQMKAPDDILDAAPRRSVSKSSPKASDDIIDAVPRRSVSKGSSPKGTVTQRIQEARQRRSSQEEKPRQDVKPRQDEKVQEEMTAKKAQQEEKSRLESGLAEVRAHKKEAAAKEDFVKGIGAQKDGAGNSHEAGGD